MAWPTKLYLSAVIPGYWQTLPLNSNDAEYIRVDIVAARELEIVRGTLESIRKLLPGTQVFFDLIEPQDILKELEKK